MNESMHRHHDLDLVSAWAEGTAADPAAARGLVASCEECAQVYRAHLAVREAIEAEEPAELTELERARLHTSVWEEVGSSPSPRTSSPWWYRLAPVAAVLVVLVGVGVSGLLGGGDSARDTAAETVAADRPTAEADQELAPLAESAPDAAGAPETTQAPENTVASAATTAAAADGLTEELAGSTEAEVSEALQDFRERVRPDEGSVPEDFNCEAPEQVTQPAVVVEGISVGGEEVWLAAFGQPGDITAVAAYARSDCELLMVEESGNG